jgi:DNA-binding NtrC family response regulator
MAKTIIVIDDDPDDIDIMEEAIQEFDPSFVCKSFTRATEALKDLTKNEEGTPEYIFIDMNMPLVGGDKCLKEFRENPRFDGAVITMISTSMPENVATSLKKAGADFTFQKPSRFEALNNILKSVFSYHRTA